MTQSAYSPHAEDFDIDAASVEELEAAIGVLNSVSKEGMRIDPRRSGSLSTKELRRVARIHGALRKARAAAAQYVVCAVYDMLDEHPSPAFRAAFEERAGPDPRRSG